MAWRNVDGENSARTDRSCEAAFGREKGVRVCGLAKRSRRKLSQGRQKQRSCSACCLSEILHLNPRKPIDSGPEICIIKSVCEFRNAKL